MNRSMTLDPANLWRRYPRETAGLALLGLIGTAAIVGTASSTLRPADDATSQAALPPPPPMEYRPIAAGDAVKINGSIPVAGPAGAALPFAVTKGSKLDRSRALECLASAIYYEAGQESTDGQRAVAQVILNRVRHPAFPSSVCGVVYQGSTRQTGCQFTFTCDGSMGRAPNRYSWNRASRVAAAALAGSVYPNVGNATHYHADYVVPYWASTLAKTAVIGAHLFYRWSGGWGSPKAFGQAYSNREADPRVLSLAAMSVVRTRLGETPPATEVAGTDIMVKADGNRVRVLFSQQAREAVEKVKHQPYVERVAATDNLRWTLGDSALAATEPALGAKTGAPVSASKAN